MASQQKTTSTLNPGTDAGDLLSRLEARFRIVDDTFDVKLPGGESITFKTVRNVSDRMALSRAASDFADLISGEGAKIPAPWRGVLKSPIDRGVAETLGAIAHLAVKPKFTHLDVLRLHSLPIILDLIVFQISQSNIRFGLAQDAEEISEEKKSSNGIQPGFSGSESAETP